MKELLQRYIKGEVSEKERLKIASWLDESPENMREFRHSCKYPWLIFVV